MNPKILVLNPGSIFTKNVVRDVLYGCWCKGKRIGGGTVPPFELLMIATILQNDGGDVTFLDAAAEKVPLARLRDLIRGYSFVIMSTSTMTINEDARLLQELKTAEVALRTIVFGSHPTFMPVHTLHKKGIDIIVRREPEYAIRDLVRAVRNDTSWETCKGIGFMRNDQPVLNEFYPHIQNLDDLPFLNVDLLPKNVHYFNPIVKKMPYITCTTSAGCPARCTFCTAPFFHGALLRFKSAPKVFEEISYYISKGYKEIYFRDETFTADRKRVQELCQMMIERGLHIPWICNARIGTVDEELLALMKKAGCHLIKFGVESGVQEILDASRKGIKASDTLRTIGWTNKLGIDSHAHVMLGMPGETNETIKQTVEFVKRLNPTTATFGICTPYPGTPLFELVEKKFPEIRDGSEVDLSKLHTEGLFNSLYTSVDAQTLEQAVQKAYRSFYLRPSFFLKTLLRIRSFDDIMRFLIAGSNVLDFAVRGE